ncbi:hypothetical protein JCM3774_005882 [Rhodotorula dairenensis]
MDFDPTLFTAANTDREPGTAPAAAAPLALALDAISLPAQPRPSLSPAASRVFDRKHADQSPRTNTGLDLSQSPHPAYAASRAAEMMTPPATTSGAAHNAFDDDRDTASIRQNILHLVNAGQSRSNSSPGSTPSLAQMMGASGQKRTHRVNTGMTELEREETERLEREMAATRAKWAAKNPSSTAAAAAGANDGPDSGGRPAGGLSLASLLTGKTTSRAATAPAVMEPSHDHAESPQMKDGPAAPIPEERTQSPSHDMPERASVEPVARFAASPEPTADSAREPPRRVPSVSAAPPDARPSTEEPASSPRKPPTEPLSTRLHSSHIVADRLRWSEQIQQQQQQQHQAGDEASKAPPSPEKRRSLLERWGRDEPDARQGDGGSIVPASPTTVRTRLQSIFDRPAENESKSQQQITKEQPASPTKSTARSETAPPTLEAPATPLAGSGKADLNALGVADRKPTWQGAPIGVKSTSKPHRHVQDREEPGHSTRRVALPGMGTSSLSNAQQQPTTRPVSPLAPNPPVETSRPAQPTPPASPTKSSSGGGGGSVSSVRAAAMRWGQQQADAAAEEEKRATLLALKASYGVKVDAATPPVRQSTMPAPSSSTAAAAANRESTVAVPQKSKSVDAASFTPSVAAPSSYQETTTSAGPAAPPPSRARPDLSVSTGPASPQAPLTSDDILSLVLSQPEPYHLPPGGETLSLDVFHLNSPTDDPDPIDHNHVLHTTEILGIVHRAAEDPDDAGAGIRTHVWIWKGDEAHETKRTDERIVRLEDKTGVEAVEIEYRHEPPALAEAFEGQLTICRGPRETFDHLGKRMFSVQSHDGVVYVEEVPAASRSLCSGYSTTFSALGEVYAWLGEGSLESERQACCEFAEAIADGRTVTVLPEGEETAMFWHHLPDDNEYASAQYWRRRPSHPERTTVVRVDSSSASAPFTLVPEGTVPTDAVSVIDGGSAEHWVVVPEAAEARKADIETALEAAKRLSEAWKGRGFASRTPYHLIAFPSLVPRDLAFLSRSLDLEALNSKKQPTKMRVFTADEARSEFV